MFSLEIQRVKKICKSSNKKIKEDLIIHSKWVIFLCINISPHKIFKNIDLCADVKTKLKQSFIEIIVLFRIDHFKEGLGNNLKNNSITECSNFENIFLKSTVNMHLSKKKKRY